jgi:hypothetical protein
MGIYVRLVTRLKARGIHPREPVLASVALCLGTKAPRYLAEADIPCFAVVRCCGCAGLIALSLEILVHQRLNTLTLIISSSDL